MGESSVFSRIDPDHPLAQAARAVNAYSEEQGLPATLEWLKLGIGPGELAYLAEQRGLRTIAAASGMNMGGDERVDSIVATAIIGTPLWRDMRELLLALWLDGVVTGWYGHEIATREDEQG